MGGWGCRDGGGGGYSYIQQFVPTGADPAILKGVWGRGPSIAVRPQ